MIPQKQMLFKSFTDKLIFISFRVSTVFNTSIKPQHCYDTIVIRNMFMPFQKLFQLQAFNFPFSIFFSYESTKPFAHEKVNETKILKVFAMCPISSKLYFLEDFDFCNVDVLRKRCQKYILD